MEREFRIQGQNPKSHLDRWSLWCGGKDWGASVTRSPRLSLRSSRRLNGRAATGPSARGSGEPKPRKEDSENPSSGSSWAPVPRCGADGPGAGSPRTFTSLVSHDKDLRPARPSWEWAVGRRPRRGHRCPRTRRRARRPPSAAGALVLARVSGSCSHVTQMRLAARERVAGQRPTGQVSPQPGPQRKLCPR